MTAAAILSVLVLLTAWGGEAAPSQYSSYQPHFENSPQYYHHLHLYHHHHHHHDLQHEEEESSHSGKLEDPEAKRPPPVGLMLITQNPYGLCRTENTTCHCLAAMREKRLSECGDSFPLWTVDSLWQGNIPRSRKQPIINIHVCNEDDLSDSSVTDELNKLTDEEHECLRSVWPPLNDDGGDCSEDSAIIYQGSVQGNCSLIYEQFSLDMYYRKVIDLYELVNGASESCKTRARACGNRTAAADTDHDDASPPLPLPTYTPALNEKIHLSLMQLGLTNTKGTTINPSALKDVFGANVYMGCMSSGQGGLGQYILTRVAFCFRCSGTNPHQPCDEIQLADCWTDAKNPPSTVPWADTYGDVPCYTGKKQVCYCGFNRMAYCSC